MPGEKELQLAQMEPFRAQQQRVSGVQWDLSTVGCDSELPSSTGKLSCRNTLQLLPHKDRELLKEPVVFFKQYRCIMYITLLLSLDALWECLAFLFFC